MGFCAKVGETEPAAVIPTRKAASRVRAVSRIVHLLSATKALGLRIASAGNGLSMPQRVFMTMIAPRNPAQEDGFIYICPEWNVSRVRSVTLAGQLITTGKDYPGEWPGEGPFQGHPSSFDPESGHKIWHSENCESSLTRASHLDNEMEHS